MLFRAYPKKRFFLFLFLGCSLKSQSVDAVVIPTLIDTIFENQSFRTEFSDKNKINSNLV